MITPDQAIILSLNEPRIYSKLFDEAVKYRKEDGQTLSRETFDQALKRLVFDEFVIKENIDGRSKQYSLNPQYNKETITQLFFDCKKELKEKINWFEKILSKMDIKKAQSSSKKRQQYEIIYSEIFLLCLEYQKRLFFLTHIPIPNTSLEKIFATEQKRIAKILTKFPTLLPYIGPDSFDSVSIAVNQIIQLDISRHEKALETTAKNFLGKI